MNDKSRLLRIVLCAFVFALAAFLLFLIIKSMIPVPSIDSNRDEYEFIEAETALAEFEPPTTEPPMNPPCSLCSEDDSLSLEEVKMLAKTVWGEGRGVSDWEKELIIWCVLNRVDDPDFPDTIASVVSAPGQFDGYLSNYPVESEIYDLCLRVCSRWLAGEERALPIEYVFFFGDGSHNYFYDRNKNFYITNY